MVARHLCWSFEHCLNSMNLRWLIHFVLRSYCYCMVRSLSWLASPSCFEMDQRSSISCVLLGYTCSASFSSFIFHSNGMWACFECWSSGRGSRCFGVRLLCFDLRRTFLGRDLKTAARWGSSCWSLRLGEKCHLHSADNSRTGAPFLGARSRPSLAVPLPLRTSLAGMLPQSLYRCTPLNLRWGIPRHTVALADHTSSDWTSSAQSKAQGLRCRLRSQGAGSEDRTAQSCSHRLQSFEVVLSFRSGCTAVVATSSEHWSSTQVHLALPFSSGASQSSPGGSSGTGVHAVLSRSSSVVWCVLTFELRFTLRLCHRSSSIWSSNWSIRSRFGLPCSIETFASSRQVQTLQIWTEAVDAEPMFGLQTGSFEMDTFQFDWLGCRMESNPTALCSDLFQFHYWHMLL